MKGLCSKNTDCCRKVLSSIQVFQQNSDLALTSKNVEKM